MPKKLPEKSNSLKLFEDKQIRSVWNEKEEEWYFSVVDVVAVLADQDDYKKVRNYWKWLKNKLKEEGSQLVSETNQLKMRASDGKMYLTDAMRTEQVLRLIQTIPSPKAEPFKLWLAEVGKERIDEIHDPELAVQRMRRIYAQKGYSESWIQQRERAIAARNKLTDEWKFRGAKEGRDFAILTNEIYKTGFGLDAKAYKNLKGVEKKHNLRDSMTEMELALTNLGETTARELHKTKDSFGMAELKQDAGEAGEVVETARVEAEKRLGKPIVTNELPEGASQKRISQ